MLKIKCIPVTWPIGMGQDFIGVYHLTENKMYFYQKGHGGKMRLADPLYFGEDGCLP